MTGVTNSKLLPQRMPALNSSKQNMHAPPKQNSHTVPLQLVYPNMHKARSFPRSPAKNSGYFHSWAGHDVEPSAVGIHVDGNTYIALIEIAFEAGCGATALAF